MAGASLRIDVEIEDREVQDAVKRLVSAGVNMRPVFAEIGEYLDLSTRERFDAEQAPDGSSWEPLSDKTVRRKMFKGVRRGKGKKRKRLTGRDGSTKAAAIKALARHQILVESGDLRDTLRYEADDDRLLFGTDRKYGATHQFGDEERGIPERQYLGLSEKDKAEILRILSHHYESASRG